jgi:hypothetical protein
MRERDSANAVGKPGIARTSFLLRPSSQRLAAAWFEEGNAMTAAALACELLDRLDVGEDTAPDGEPLTVRSPIDGSILR